MKKVAVQAIPDGTSAPTTTSNRQDVARIAYVALQRANDNMTESQKEGVRVWNLMVKTLRDNGLMDDKQ